MLAMALTALPFPLIPCSPGMEFSSFHLLSRRSTFTFASPCVAFSLSRSTCLSVYLFCFLRSRRCVYTLPLLHLQLPPSFCLSLHLFPRFYLREEGRKGKCSAFRLIDDCFGVGVGRTIITPCRHAAQLACYAQT